MKKLTISIFMVFIIALLGCDTENDILLRKRLLVEDPPNEALTSDDIYFLPINPENICGAIVEKPLKANDEFIGGLLSIANNEDNIIVSFKTIEGWMIGETHLFLGDIENLPATNSGNPILGQFPYKTYEEPQVEITISVLRSALVFEDENITIVAQAKIFKGEGEDLVTRSVFAEWDENLLFAGPRWGGGFAYELQSCDLEVADPELGLNENLDGEATELIAEELICVEAGMPRDLIISEKGVVDIVGSVDFSTDAENFNIIYTLTPDLENDWEFYQVHVNIGLLDASQMGKGRNSKPILGKFDYVKQVAKTDIVDNTYIYSIPLDDFGIDFFETGNCVPLVVQVSLSMEVVVNEVIELVTTSAFAIWDVPFSTSLNVKGGYFELCVVDCPVE